ncbi:MAG: phosphoribosylformylglycinamidine synthase I [Armatimonadetes bacterium]|nr:phosphoribosylformylglycinamidine synthase I [Armatimonadota bacterium]
MSVAVIRFPGSNCDTDCVRATEVVAGLKARVIWHQDAIPAEISLVILPGGFSYGDYLRPGAIARFAPAMAEVRRFADRGGHVLGICNGFQILTEAGMLPGALLPNGSLSFVCQDVRLRVERTDTPFTRRYKKGQVLRMPVAHGDGRYFSETPPQGVVFRYVDENGDPTPEANPNGALDNIAGMVNARGNVLGMMPHPERACETLLGSTDGRALFESVLESSLGVGA